MTSIQIDANFLDGSSSISLSPSRLSKKKEVHSATAVAIASSSESPIAELGRLIDEEVLNSDAVW